MVAPQAETISHSAPATHLRKDGREEIAVVGGGLSGALSALMLARVKDKNNKPKYHVTIFEKQDKLLNGTSLLASRLHLGGEYPKDERTAKDCLMGAVIWKLVMPDHIYTDRETMKFAVSKKSHNMKIPEPILPPVGRLATPEEQAQIKQREKEIEQAKAERIPLEDYADAYEKIRLKYQEIFNKVHRAKTEETRGKKSTGKDWSKADTEKLLFGSYEDGKFVRRLRPDELTAYDNQVPDKNLKAHSEFSSMIEGGFQTQELGLNIPLYLSALEAAINEEKDAGNIDVRLNSEVSSIARWSDTDPFTIHMEKDGYNIKKPYQASQVVQSAFEWNTKLLSNNLSNNIKAPHVYNRAMILLDLGPGGAKNIGPLFRMLGPQEGGMLSPYNDRYAICYYPSMAYEGGDKALDLNNPSPPPVSEDDSKIWEKQYVKALQLRFPVLQGKEYIRPLLLLRSTVSYQGDLAQRRHEPVESVGSKGSGHIVLNPTKATLAPQSALEAVEMVLARSEGREPYIEPEKSLNMALNGAYSLKDIKLDTSKAMQFSQARGLPANLVDPSLPDDVDPALQQFTSSINRKRRQAGQSKNDGRAI